MATNGSFKYPNWSDTERTTTYQSSHVSGTGASIPPSQELSQVDSVEPLHMQMRRRASSDYSNDSGYNEMVEDFGYVHSLGGPRGSTAPQSNVIHQPVAYREAISGLLTDRLHANGSQQSVWSYQSIDEAPPSSQPSFSYGDDKVAASTTNLSLHSKTSHGTSVSPLTSPRPEFREINYGSPSLPPSEYAPSRLTDTPDSKIVPRPLDLSHHTHHVAVPYGSPSLKAQDDYFNRHAPGNYHDSYRPYSPALPPTTPKTPKSALASPRPVTKWPTSEPDPPPPIPTRSQGSFPGPTAHITRGPGGSDAEGPQPIRSKPPTQLRTSSHPSPRVASTAYRSSYKSPSQPSPSKIPIPKASSLYPRIDPSIPPRVPPPTSRPSSAFSSSSSDSASNHNQHHHPHGLVDSVRDYLHKSPKTKKPSKSKPKPKSKSHSHSSHSTRHPLPPPPNQSQKPHPSKPPTRAHTTNDDPSQHELLSHISVKYPSAPPPSGITPSTTTTTAILTAARRASHDVYDTVHRLSSDLLVTSPTLKSPTNPHPHHSHHLPPWKPSHQRFKSIEYPTPTPSSSTSQSTADTPHKPSSSSGKRKPRPKSSDLLLKPLTSLTHSLNTHTNIITHHASKKAGVREEKRKEALKRSIKIVGPLRRGGGGVTGGEGEGGGGGGGEGEEGEIVEGWGVDLGVIGGDAMR
ncbi:MAG: hypothetical protein Q9227_002490 [Pyrenula ochraceoflavens]